METKTNRTIMYCIRDNIEGFIDCDINCMLSVQNKDSTEGCLFNKDIKQHWAYEDDRQHNNLYCNKCSTRSKRYILYDTLKFYNVFMWACYNCNSRGYTIKDQFSGGCLWHKKKIKYLCEQEHKEYLLDVFDKLDHRKSYKI